MMKKYLIFDIGALEVVYSILTEDGQIRVKGSFMTPKTKLEDLYRQMDRIVKCYGSVFDGISIACIGIVDSDLGIIKAVNEIPYVKDIHIKEDLEEKYKIRVHVENNTICAAISEIRYGAAKDLQDVVYISLGSAVGGAIIKDRKIYRGKNYFAGEFGLMYCYEENNKTLSSLSVDNLFIKICYFLGRVLNKDEVFILVDDENLEIKKIFSDWYRSLAKGIISLQYAYDPEKIIVGGELGNQPYIISKIRDEIEQMIGEIKGVKLMPKIECKEVKKSESILGALSNFLLKEELALQC